MNTYTEKVEKLTTEDIAKLKNKWGDYAGVIIGALILGVSLWVASIPYVDYFKGEPKDDTHVILGGFFHIVFIAFSFLLSFFLKKFINTNKDIANGEKIVLTGILTDKKIVVSESTSSSGDSGGFNRGGGGGSTKSSTTHQYYIFMGEKKFEVEEKQYFQIRINEIVSEHYGPLSQKVIHLQ